MEQRLSSNWTYEELQKRIEADNRKQEARQRAARRKSDERRAIRKGGGGISLAKAVLGPAGDGTDFEFGHNEPVRSSSESIDERIAREQAGRCLEKIYCQACKRYHGLCSEIAEEKEKLKMLPTGDGNNNSRRNTGGGLPFINTEDLSTQPQEAKILMVKFTEKGGKSNQPSITLKVAFKGEIKYVWMPARISDPRYKMFLDAFGPDENNWVDERFTMQLKKDEFTEKYQTQFNIIQEKKGARK